MVMNWKDALACLVAARRDSTRVVLEGLHPLKHAVRFGADVDVAVTSDVPGLIELAASVAPELVPWLRNHAVEAPRTHFDACRSARLASPIMAVAKIPGRTMPTSGVVIMLEKPVHLGNIGAVVRVAAGLGAAAVTTTGPADPWHPTAIRGAAGLQFALPVLRVKGPPADRPLVLLDPHGEPITPSAIPANAILAFGTERGGLSADLRAKGDRYLAIPTQPGVSSLNLATAVAITLWTWRLGLPRPPAAR